VNSTRLFDCFTFFNELDVLDLRLRELAPLVSKFVLLESELTFTGNRKPLFYAENKKRFARYAPQIEHVVLRASDFPPGLQTAWDREFFSRRSLLRGLQDAKPDDLVLISDVDEIPKPENLRAELEDTPGSRLTLFESVSFNYCFNLRANQYALVQAPRLLARRYCHDPQAVRALQPRASKRPLLRILLEPIAPVINRLRTWPKLGAPVPVRIVRNAAWHFTNIGAPDQIRDKLLAFSHTEVATSERTDLGNIADHIARQHALFGGKLEAISPLHGDLPASLREDPERWRHLLVDAPAPPTPLESSRTRR
jgi:beta-1,4-mannosyl-glycoprotein beta-1,4-N-acetylglucosaminyltransferase